MWLYTVVLLVLLEYLNCPVSGGSHALDDEFLNGTFPDGFVWGTATSSYQIEGAWDTDGKGENIWDRFCHDGNNVENNHTGDVACDSYNRWEEDINLIQNLGVRVYRFSLSWARILPDGTTGNVNQAGIDYYRTLINGLIEADIEPMVTLFHWDLPQALQDIGGWENELLVEYFRDYAELCFRELGDGVPWWITFNEPWVFIINGLVWGSHAPGYTDDPGEVPYIAGHNVIKAHAEAWHVYDQQFRPTQNGQIAMTLSSSWNEPTDWEDPEHVAAADEGVQFEMGWFAHPIYIGEYPPVMRSNIDGNSIAQGYNQSRLPSFTEDEIQRILGTNDFFGLNTYTTYMAERCEKPLFPPSYDNDQNVCGFQDPSWPSTGSSWLKVVPWGMRSLLNWIKDEYGNPEVFITENGVSDRNSSMDDQHRVNYYRDYINEVLKAVELDGCDVMAYTAWSLMDNFEWAAGYMEKFGMHYVDFEDPERTRTPKASAEYFKQIVEDNGFPVKL